MFSWPIVEHWVGAKANWGRTRKRKKQLQFKEKSEPSSREHDERAETEKKAEPGGAGQSGTMENDHSLETEFRSDNPARQGVPVHSSWQT